nr:HD domain-containing protein [Sneathiella aquimaris]
MNVVTSINASASEKMPSIDGKLFLSEVIGALSYALDMTEGQPAGHSIRCCYIGMHLGKKLGLDQQQQWDLYYTLLLKDAGCSSNAARLYELYGCDERDFKHEFKLVDNTDFREVSKFIINHVGVGESFLSRLKRLIDVGKNGSNYAVELIETRCERGADIAIRLGFNEAIADGIRYLDEHWNGEGKPYRKSGHEIPVNSQIALLAQVADVFFISSGQDASLEQVTRRSGSWFDPNLVALFDDIANDDEFWQHLNSDDLQQQIMKLEPASMAMRVSEERLDDITAAFGMIVDTKSSFTFDHSSRVALYTESIAKHFGYEKNHLSYLRRAALLHDIGKLGVSNDILDKPGKLDDHEWAEIRKHSKFTEEILSHLSPFTTMAKMAGAHHEKLDGTGYPYGLCAEEIHMDTRIITAADIFDAITAARPYRGAVPVEKTLEIMRGECGTSIDPVVFDALQTVVSDLALK